METVGTVSHGVGRWSSIPNNTLDLVPIWPHKIGWKKPKPPNKMSIIAGVICRDAIILAADSQTMESNQGTHDLVEKIKDVQFGLDTVVVASAGLPAFTNRVIEKMQMLSMGIKEITNQNDVRTIFEESIRQSKAPLDEQQSTYIEQHGAEMLCVFYAIKNQFFCR